MLIQNLLSIALSLPVLAQEQMCPWLWQSENTGQRQEGYSCPPLLQLENKNKSKNKPKYICTYGFLK